METSGRFVKQEQWERWRAKRILVSGSKHRGACGGPGGGYHPQKSLEITYAQHPAIWCFSGRKTVRSAVHNAFESL